MATPRVDPPRPATSVLVDLRNFTPNLNEAGHDPDGTNQFCHFLAQFYSDTLDACRLALAPSERSDPRLMVNSTGDGLLVVFFGPRHFANGLLAGFLLEAGLRRCCARRNENRPRDAPDVSFGVGIESGEVSRLHAGTGAARVDTFIGHCINVSARIEALTKLVAHATVLIGDTCVELCTEAFFGETFARLREREQQAAFDEERVAVQKRMDDINRELCLTFLDRYILKGVDDPLPLYRLDGSATRAGVGRFDRMLRHLVDGNEAHLVEARTHLEL